MVELSWNARVKEEIGRHLEKIEINDINKNEVVSYYDNVAIKKHLRLKFIQHGLVYAPEKKYHLEYNYNNLDEANETIKYLVMNDIVAKLSINKNERYIVYIVDEKNILKTLKLLGANDIYSKYKMVVERNKKAQEVNRAVNCEIANIKKYVNANLKQVNDIKELLKIKKIEELDDNLQEVVRGRLENDVATMQELAEILNISKSALNHRFRRIREMLKGG